MKFFFLIYLLTILFVENGYSMQPYRWTVHVSIDSLATKNLEGQFVNLVLKGDSINVKYKDESTSAFRYTYKPSSIGTNELEQTNDSSNKIFIEKFLFHTNDSIYLTALSEDSNILDTISINKSELKELTYQTYASTKGKKSLYAGVGKNFKDDKDKEHNRSSYILAELGYSIGLFDGIMGYSIYGGSEFLFNKDKFLVAPKIGVDINIFIFKIGNEIIQYTDFKNTTLSYKPYFGIGGLSFRLSIGYNVFIYNKRTYDLSHGTVNLTIPFYIKDRK